MAEAERSGLHWQLADIYDNKGAVLTSPAGERIFGPAWAKVLVERGDLTEAQAAVLASATETDVESAAATFSLRGSYERRVQTIRATEANGARIGLYTSVADGSTAYVPTSEDIDAEDLGPITSVLAMEPWYVAPDVCALLDHAAPQMPDWELAEDDVPASGGLIVFADAIETDGHELDADVPYWVNAMSCMLVQIGDGEGDRFIQFDDWEASARADGGSGWQWMSAGRHSWVIGTHVDDFDRIKVRKTNEAEGFIAESAVMRRRIACLWALAKTPRLIEGTKIHETRPAQRRAARAGIKTPVVLYDVRPTDRSGASTGERPTDWTHRWIVEGHWRQQAHGPDRSLRRPTWIAPHIKGPDDKPLVVKDRVGIVRGDPPRAPK